jgi:hypothetical protein
VKKKKNSMKTEAKRISAKDLDRKFDSGSASILPHLDLETATFRVNVDFPAWTVSALDREATRLGVTRQSLIKIWIIERLDHLVQITKKAR